MPDFINNKFDPDKIYDRIAKLLDSLNPYIVKLTRQKKIKY